MAMVVVNFPKIIYFVVSSRFEISIISRFVIVFWAKNWLHMLIDIFLNSRGIPLELAR